MKIEKTKLDQYYPDVTKFAPSRTGMRIILVNLFVIDCRSFNGWDWDVMCKMYVRDEDDPDIPEYLAVSLAVKGFEAIVEQKLYRGAYISSVEGVFGKKERSISEKEKFRRVFCELKDINLHKPRIL